MPNKSRTLVEPVRLLYHGVSNAGTIDLDLGEFNIPISHEAIRYENSIRKRTNFCFHTCETHLNNGGPISYGYSNATHTLSSVIGGIAYGNINPHLLRCDRMADYSAWVVEEWDKLRPSMKSPVNLLSFLWELREIRRLVDLWSSRRTLLKNAANGHLNYSFGWKPFVADLSNIWNLLQSFYTRYNELQLGMLLPIRRYARRVLPSALPGRFTWYGSQSNAEGYGYTVYERGFEPFQVLALRFTYSLPGEPLDAVFAALDALGISSPLATLWDAVPYSFMIDWFFGVGDSLKRLTPDLFEIDTVLLSASVSQKAAITSNAFRRWGDSQETHAVTRVHRQYERHPLGVMDLEKSVISSRSAGLREGLLTGSLMLTRFNRKGWSRATRRALRGLFNSLR